MARPLKSGLEYFSHDVDLSSDPKIELLEAKHGLIGYGIYLKLLERIYRNGYYLSWDKNTALILARRVIVDINSMSGVINDAVEIALFSKEKLDKYGVLTSHGIQSRYLKSCVRRKMVTFIKELLLIDVNAGKNEGLEVVIVDINSSSPVVNDNKSTQSKVKKSKEKKRNIRAAKISEAFERWWKTYPEREGRKLGKKVAASIFKKIPQKLWDDLKIATTNYIKYLECGVNAKDPERFLRNNFWKDFIKPAVISKPQRSKKPKEKTFEEVYEEMKKEGYEKGKQLINLN